MTEPVLKVSNYNVDFWVDGTWYPAAIDMNYEVLPGKTLAIVGESGSGKSSSSMGLMGLLASNARTIGTVPAAIDIICDMPQGSYFEGIRNISLP